ncbi:unnamed protein product [Ranitomeya imitator]|uniref:Uncharacterized protein n=1 Tax=Ranitomeya imitator TaxID=111125 RepID=A0ABN9LXM9_9NEOB|nr:unnamed protein product [Ranitomeya imitator]
MSLNDHITYKTCIVIVYVSLTDRISTKYQSEQCLHSLHFQDFSELNECVSQDHEDGNQGKHRVTKRGPALSYPMFTLVTSEDIAESASHTPIQR